MKLENRPFDFMGMPNQFGGKYKRLDWEKAKRICEENPTSTIEAGLAEDWSWTSGTIFENGEYKRDSYVYSLSRWATPVLVIDNCEPVECWILSEDSSDPNIPDNWGEG